MDDAELRRRLWEGFAALQTLLGGSAREGRVIQRPGLVASIVPSAPDSPALNAAVALDPSKAPDHLEELEVLYGAAGVRRWAVWIDGAAREITNEFRLRGLAIASASPGMGAVIERAGHRSDHRQRPPERRAEDRRACQRPRLRQRRLAPRKNADDPRQRASCAATGRTSTGRPARWRSRSITARTAACRSWPPFPQARRHGLATQVMRAALADAQRHGQTTITLQATELGERLYHQLGLRRLGPMELWEHRR